MAQVAGTTDTYVSKGIREDLQDKIFMISKADTPFMTAVGTGTATSTRHEWQTDVLAAADTTNAQIEGDTYAYAIALAPTRVGNYTQISRKPVLISGTLEVVKKAGRSSEMKYQAMKQGMNLKRDMEAILTSAQASNAGSAAGGAARKTAGFQAFLTTNTSRGTGGANGGFNSGTGLVAAPTAGTARTLTETMVKDMQQSSYIAGGNPDVLMLPPAQKRSFSAFTGIAQSRRETGNRLATIIGGADVYVGDFGELTTVPNRQMTPGVALGIDPSFVSVDYLRRMFVDKPAKDGDAFKRMMVVEYTLAVLNEAANFLIADLT
jgi:hypothetical protein